MTFHLATSPQARSPVRPQQWNGSIRAGDDLKLALTVYADDSGTVAALPGSRSRLALYCDQSGHDGWGACRDYGWGWYSGPATPAQQVDGYAAGSAWPGQINFALAAASTIGMRGRYRMLLELDMDDGSSTQVEGILQVRGGITNTLGHVGRSIFILDQSLLDGPDILAGLLNDAGAAVDADGFPLVALSGGVLVAPASVPLFTLVATGLIATGTNQATALPLTALTNVLTGGAAGSGAMLPAGVLSGTIDVLNADAIDHLVYPLVGGTIGTAGVNIPVIVSPGQRVSFVTQDGLQWFAA
jgi:hypothetical protein